MHLTLRVDLHATIPAQSHTKRVEWLVKEGIADFVFPGNVRWRVVSLTCRLKAAPCISYGAPYGLQRRLVLPFGGNWGMIPSGPPAEHRTRHRCMHVVSRGSAGFQRIAWLSSLCRLGQDGVDAIISVVCWCCSCKCHLEGCGLSHETLLSSFRANYSLEFLASMNAEFVVNPACVAAYCSG